MKKLLWLTVWTLVALTLVAFFGFAWAPMLVRAYVEKHYPGVSVGDASIRWQFVLLKDIQVHRENLSATIPMAFVDWDKNITLYGGHIDLLIASNSNSSVGSQQQQKVRGFDVDVTLTKGDLKANLMKASFDATRVTFASGQASKGTYNAHIAEGVFTLKDKVLQAKRVQVPLSLPVAVPRMDTKQIVEGTEVRLDPSSRTATFKVKIGETLQTKALSKATLSEDLLKLELSQLEVSHPWVSPEPVTFRYVEVLAPLEIIHGQSDLSVKLGTAEVSLDLERFRVIGSGSCNAWAEAMPEPLPIALKEAQGHFSGDLSFEVERDPAPQLKIRNTCKFDCREDPIKDLKDGRIAYMAYDKQDRLFPRTVGPKEAEWTSIGSLPLHVPTAFVTLEDPGFNSHRGVIPQALENSLKDNLRLGQFFRGGSTISMQLAKNLWLRRHKTLGRKAQEVLLTIALESCLSKAEILELYLNVVEFGPNLYGIGPASRFYFDHPPEHLEADEAFYLASILPRPRKSIPPRQGGLERTRSLMKTLAGRGLINDSLIPLENTGDDTGWVTE